DARIAQLRDLTLKPGFWDDADAAQKTMQELSRLEAGVEPWHSIRCRLDDAAVLLEMAAEEEDPEGYADEVRAELERVQEDWQKLEMADILSGPHDASNAIVEINSGAGGTEACDWVAMLLRMYLRWAEAHGFQAEIMDELPGEVAGLKNVTFEVRGPYAYGHLKSEHGVHRLVRISPFDANKRRHTSFASVDVVPEIQEADDVQINPDDLRIDTYRSSGAGGQNVQKNETAIRITHLPTGIVVSCQNERSQLKNREFAMKVLRSRLAEIQRKEQEARMAELRDDQRAIEWGNHIRSYVLDDRRVKDHRTGEETGNVTAVLDGEIDPFIHAYLTQFRGQG
ncbi:MAG TPA: peptide chain release factor 2, partial [Armatimonadota bacterium]|nr:peptide chain release factor 2 [Armatimonadota bacterium]